MSLEKYKTNTQTKKLCQQRGQLRLSAFSLYRSNIILLQIDNGQPSRTNFEAKENCITLQTNDSPIVIVLKNSSIHESQFYIAEKCQWTDFETLKTVKRSAGKRIAARNLESCVFVTQL